MYQEIKENFLKYDFDEEFIDKLFSIKKYQVPGFWEYVFRRFEAATPIDAEQWLKSSLKHLIKVYSHGKSKVVIAKKKAQNDKRKETLKENTINTKFNKMWNDMSDEDKKKYTDIAKAENKPGFLINIRAFALFLEEMEKSE